MLGSESYSEQGCEYIPSLAAVLLIFRAIIHCSALPVLGVPAQQDGTGSGSTLSSPNWLNLSGTRENNSNSNSGGCGEIGLGWLGGDKELVHIRALTHAVCIKMVWVCHLLVMAKKVAGTVQHWVVF